VLAEKPYIEAVLKRDGGQAANDAVESISNLPECSWVLAGLTATGQQIIQSGNQA